jgi:hypothetical protein
MAKGVSRAFLNGWNDGRLHGRREERRRCLAILSREIRREEKSGNYANARVVKVMREYLRGQPLKAQR